MAGADSIQPTVCAEREFLLQAEDMWRVAAVLIEQPLKIRADLAQAALDAQRERYRHEERCALCRQIESKSAPEMQLAAAD
jgi:hypothetical protein